MTATTYPLYLGLDFGTTTSSICQTQYEPLQNQFREPEAIPIKGAPTIRSLFLTDESGEKIIAIGEEVYKEDNYRQHPERVREEFKLKLGSDPQGPREVRLFCEQLMGQVVQHFAASNATLPDTFRTTIGAPAQWSEKEPERVALLRGAAEAAGFRSVEVVPEPIAAMHYHDFLGHLHFEQRLQRWLIIDFGGGTTDLALVETAPNGESPTVIATFGQNYGGKDFDCLLRDNLVLSRYEGPPLDNHQQLDLLRQVRQFKEKFSALITEGQNEHRARFTVGSTQLHISLSRQEFESKQLAGFLIADFLSIISNGMLAAQQKFQDFSAKDVDRVILTGGSARWYFVRVAAAGYFGPNTILLSPHPELAISKGLALFDTKFRANRILLPAPTLPPTPPAVDEAQRTNPTKMEGLLSRASVVDARQLNLADCRRQAQSTVTKYAAGGGALALVLSPIPGISQIPLTAGEAHLVTEIARIYGYSLGKEETLGVVAGLLAGSTLIKVGVMEAATFLPGVGWALKAGVAGAAIKALGETTIYFFEDRRRQEQLNLGGPRP